MIPKIDQEIIDKLNAGMSPAQISIQYQEQGKNVPPSYARHIKMLWKANMTHLLEEDTDIDADTRIASVTTTSREYAKRRAGNWAAEKE